MNNILVTLCVLLAVFHANAVETDDESNLEVLFVKKVDTSTKTQFLIPSDTDEATKNSLLKVAVSGSACGCGQDKCGCESTDDKPNPTEEEEETSSPTDEVTSSTSTDDKTSSTATDEETTLTSTVNETSSTATNNETTPSNAETTKSCTDCTILRINVTLPSGTPLTLAETDEVVKTLSTTIEDALKSLPPNATVDDIVATLNSTVSGLGNLPTGGLPLLGETGITDLLEGLTVNIETVTECVENPKDQKLITVNTSSSSISLDVNLCGLK